MKSENSPILDISTMKRISGQLGSNPAGVYLDRRGRRYYVKTLESPAHVCNEFIAAKLYQLAGVPTLIYRLTKERDQIATEWLQLDTKCIAHFSESERKQSQRWFAVHAWMANWDVAGFNGDNQGVVNNTVVTLDVGGALNFRALGDPKGKAFATKVDELQVLRNDKNNPHACKLFSDMSIQAIQQAVCLVTAISDEQIRETIISNGGRQGLVAKMIARKHYMACIKQLNI